MYVCQLAVHLMPPGNGDGADNLLPAVSPSAGLVVRPGSTTEVKLGHATRILGVH